MNDSYRDAAPFRLIDLFLPKSYYWHSRQWRYFRQGIPAIVVSLLVLLPAVLSPLTRRHSASRYQAAFNEAVRNENYETAHLFLQKLETLPTKQLDQNELRFNDALTKFARGQVDQAIQKMEELAPPDATGYAPAHRWLAQLQLAENPSIVGPNSESIVHHLEVAVAQDPNDTLAHLVLGNYYHRTGNRAEAVKHLRVAVESHPELHFVLANLFESLKERENANKHYQLASEMLAPKANADQQSRINLAVCHYKLGEFDKAAKVLIDGIDPAAPDPKMVNILSTFYLQESDRLRQQAKPGHPDFATCLMLLSKALELAPDNTDAINRIALIAGYQGETGQQAVETLKQLLAQGRITPTAHLILGTEALNRGEIETAKRHFAFAYRQDPKMPVLLNNIAWMLANEEPPKLEKALTIINQAIAETPATTRYYPLMIETRGQTYVKMQRWEEALTDLELALRSMAGNTEIHRSLATVYRALGDESLARKHDALSKQP